MPFTDLLFCKTSYFFLEHTSAKLQHKKCMRSVFFQIGCAAKVTADGGVGHVTVSPVASNAAAADANDGDNGAVRREGNSAYIAVARDETHL